MLYEVITAEQHAGAAIGPIEDSREHFSAHDQRALVTARANEFFSDAKRIGKTAAHSLDVESRPGIANAEARLQQGRGTRKDEVRRRGRDDDQIDAVGSTARRLDRTTRGMSYNFV